MNDGFGRILVTTDGSAEAEEAFAAMMPIVRADHPEVTVLTVCEGADASFIPPALVARACRALRANGVNAHLEIREGKPADEIVRLAKEHDLLVMSTHGRGGFRRIMLGSVTENVIRRSEGPVLVTRPGTPSAPWNRLLVALDGSPRGEQILADAAALARRLQAPIELLTAVLPPITTGGLGDVGGVQITEDPRPYLENLRKKLSSEGLSVSTMVREGRAGAQILQRAEESAGALLCMTSHGRTGLSRAVLGSIADEVIRHAPCPVLVRRSVPIESAVR